MKGKVIKKALVAITVMALALTGMPEGLLSGTAMAFTGGTVASGTCGENLTWTLDEEGVLVISGNGEMKNYNPGTMPWNNKRNDIKTVQINEGVTHASLTGFFEDCARLNNIKIPSSVTTIGYNLYYSYNNLKEIEVAEENTNYRSVDGVLYDKNLETLLCYGRGREATNFQIPESVTGIGPYAFYKCRNLKSISIPDSVDNIGVRAFSYCSNLTNITIPDGVTNLGFGTFNECSQLQSIIIPKSVTCIQENAFEGCSALTDIQVAEENPIYQSVDDVLYDKAWNKLFCYCSGKETTEFQIPEGITSINPFAFNRCECLTKITIPASLTDISIVNTDRFSVIENWSNLKTIEVAENNSAYQSVDGILYDKKLETLIYYGRGREAADFSIPDGVTRIGTDAFRGCSYLTKVTIPDTVTSIPSGCFRNCKALKNIEASQGNLKYSSIDGVLYDKAGTTLECYGGGREASHFSIPQGVTDIMAGAFYSCGNLSTVVMPDSVTGIHSGAFCRCSNLKKIQLSNSLSFIRPAAFAFCNELRNISLSSDAQITLYNGAFWSCTNLKRIRIPENVKFYDEVFPYCSPDLTIYGVKGSTAETYATNNAIKFKDISEYTEEPDGTPAPSPGNESTDSSNPGENPPSPSPGGNDSKPPTPSPGNENTNPSHPGDKDDTSSPEDSDSKPSTPSPEDNDSKPPTPSPGNENANPSHPGDKDDTSSPEGSDSKLPTPSPEGNDSKPPTPSPEGSSGNTSAKPAPEPDNAVSPISREEREKNEWQLNKKIQFGWKGNSLSVNWSKVSKASGYDLYAAACSTDYNKITVSVKGQNKTAAKITRIAGKRISKKATYKVIVRAYRLVNGRKQYIGTSADMHIAGSKNKKYTNAKSIKLPKKKISLGKKKKTAITARIVKQHRKKKLLSTAHGPRLRYTSSDSSVATVSKTGVVHTKKKGKCVIWVGALNGISKQIKVTVK